ncbi:MAG: VOC family protein [Gammaproteobacteria bacterium]|nr:VOC family protein [Gammaproteobacteria bacterium]
MNLGKSTPIFRIFDERKAKEFYVDFLGFTIDFEHRFEEGGPLYMGISREGCVIHLSEHHGDCCPGSAVRIDTDGLAEYHKEISGRNYKYYRPSIQDMPWGSRDMSVTDPFGNRLTFTTAINT